MAARTARAPGRVKMGLIAGPGSNADPLRAVSRRSTQVIDKRSNLFFAQRPFVLSAKSWHHRVRFAARNPSFPVIGIKWVAQRFQIRDHGGPVFGIVTDRAARLVKFMSKLPNGRLGVALGAIAFEYRLPITGGNLLIAAAIGIRTGRR